MNLLVATSGQELWAITSNACTREDTECNYDRGYPFNMSSSTTWEELGFFQLSDQSNLGYTGDGYYGFDSVRTGWSDDSVVAINRSIVAGTSSEDFYIGESRSKRLLRLSADSTRSAWDLFSADQLLKL